jgi:hypothetical protein
MRAIRIGSLVMWNIRPSLDYGCMGLVTSTWYIGDSGEPYFLVKWTDNTISEYGSNDIDHSNIKVVKF